ncbi:MAG: hypothetical protein Q4E47_00735 [Candidatus Saccharibacteria bacterium]|nr:hypothetical protein [Candidatus Saccharibacteria bacterium]
MKYRVDPKIIGLYIAVTVAAFVVSMPRFVMAANDKFYRASSNPDYVFDAGEEEEIDDETPETASAPEEETSETEKETESTTSTPNSTTYVKPTSSSSSSSNKKGPTAEIIEHDRPATGNTNVNSGQTTTHEKPMGNDVDNGDGAENIGTPEEETPTEETTEE